MATKSANGVVLLTFRTSGTASAAKQAGQVRDSLEKAGGGAISGSKGLGRFTSGLSGMIKKSSSWTHVAKGVLGGFAGFEAIEKATDFLKDSTQEAISNQAAQRSLSVALRNSTGATKAQSDAVGEWLGKQAEQTGVAKSALLPAFQKLATSTGSIAKAQDQLNLAQNISAGTGKDLGTVTAALQKANNGNLGALGRLGIKTKDANGKTMSLHQTLKELSKTFAGQAATKADSFEGKVNRLKETFNETKIKVGNFLIPIISKLADWIFKKGVPAAEKLADGWKKNTGFIGKLHTALTIAFSVIHAVFDWIGKHKELMKDLAIGIGIAVVAIWLWTAAQAALDAVLDANPISLIIIGIGLLVGAIIWLVANWSGVVKWGKSVWKGFIGWLTGLLHAFLIGWHIIWSSVTHFFKGVWNGIVAWVAKTFVVPLFHAFAGIHAWWSHLWHKVSGTFSDVWTGIGTIFTGAADTVLSGLQTFVNKAIDIINGITGGVSLAWTWIPGTKGIPKIPHVKLPKLASGGDVTAGNSYIVGDAGYPEVFTPGSDGHVFPRVPSMAGASAADISASLPDVAAGSASSGPTVVQLMLDQDVFMEWVLDQFGTAEARA